MCCLFIPVCVASAQTISQAEYFFDVDPGRGNGTPIVISSPADTVNFTATTSTTGLSGGLHYLFIRTRTSNGFWSLYEPQEFYIRASIIQAECFYDTDPGVQNGIPIPVGAFSDTVNFSATLSTVGLPVGEHKVFVRTKDETGFWSLYEMREFYIRNPLVNAEYFFDTDPGVGSGIPITLSVLSDTVNFNATINTTGLPVGEHKVFIRTQDEQNFWSLYEMREFYIRNPLVRAEYFFDTDPGIGNGFPIILGVLSDTVNFNATITTAGLPPGEHKVFLRTQDELNFWSLYEMREFYIKPSIISAEYFIDLDPGLGNGTPLVISPTIDSISFSSVVTTPVLPFGTHFLFVRTMDTFGNWSLYEADTFQVGSDPLPVAIIAFDAVKITAGKVRTYWETANEISCDYFIVEKSANGINFIPFDTIDGGGTSNTILRYEAIDHYPFEHLSYYRLKQTDFNGTYHYSKVIAVNFINTDLHFTVHPNPSNGVFNISGNQIKASFIDLKIFDNQGKLVFKKLLEGVSGQNSWEIDLTEWRKGLYFVQLRSDENYWTQKILME